jgi:hypothetical protein
VIVVKGKLRKPVVRKCAQVGQVVVGGQCRAPGLGGIGHHHDRIPPSRVHADQPDHVDGQASLLADLALDGFLERLAAIGTPEQAEAGVRRYQAAGATSPCIGGVAGTDFDGTLGALAHLTG